MRAAVDGINIRHAFVWCEYEKLKPCGGMVGRHSGGVWKISLTDGEDTGNCVGPDFVSWEEDRCIDMTHDSITHRSAESSELLDISRRDYIPR